MKFDYSLTVEELLLRLGDEIGVERKLLGGSKEEFRIDVDVRTTLLYSDMARQVTNVKIGTRVGGIGEWFNNPFFPNEEAFLLFKSVWKCAQSVIERGGNDLEILEGYSSILTLVEKMLELSTK